MSMEKQISACCTYDDQPVVCNIPERMKLQDIVDLIGQRWPRIVREEMLITYKIPSYERCLLSNDAELNEIYILCEWNKWT